MALLPDRMPKRADGFRERFDNYFGGVPPFSISAFLDTTKAVETAVDVYETEEKVIAVCDLPGIEQKEDMIIDVIDARHVKVSADRNGLDQFEKYRVDQQERYTGRVEREITLPADVALDQTKATYRNGVLYIELPKKEKGLQPLVDIKFEG